MPIQTDRLVLISFLAAVAPLAAAQSLTTVPKSSLTGSPQTKAGYGAPQGSYQTFDTTGDLAAQANGAAPATASSTLAGYPDIHAAAYLNDGQYGNGSSWIAAVADSFVTIDLSDVRTISSVLFGRDRLGGFDDRDPGRFTISTSLDDSTYTTAFDSATLGFSGVVSGDETLKATFAGPLAARYVRLQFANAGTAIDEVEVQAVPEPGTMVALGLGAFGILKRRRKA